MDKSYKLFFAIVLNHLKLSLADEEDFCAETNTVSKSVFRHKEQMTAREELYASEQNVSLFKAIHIITSKRYFRLHL